MNNSRNNDCICFNSKIDKNNIEKFSNYNVDE